MLNRTSDGDDALVYIVDVQHKKVLDIILYKHYKIKDSKKYTFLTTHITNAMYFDGLRKYNIV